MCMCMRVCMCVRVFVFIACVAYTPSCFGICTASMQVTFVPETPLDPAMEEHVIEVPIGSTVYNVYTHSYLNYGLEAAQKLLQSKLSSLEGAELLGDGNPCYLKDYRLRDGTEGSGSHEKCSTLLDVLFDKSNCSFMPPTCSFNGVFQPKITTEKFYAIENVRDCDHACKF